MLNCIMTIALFVDEFQQLKNKCIHTFEIVECGCIKRRWAQIGCVVMTVIFGKYIYNARFYRMLNAQELWEQNLAEPAIKCV